MRKLLPLLTGLAISFSIQAQVSTFPWTEDFEGTNTFTFSGTGSSWAVGTVAESGFYTSYQGSEVLGTNLSGDLVQGELSYATSPVYDFSALSEDPFVSFALKYDLREGFSNDLKVELSLDGGSSWSTLGSAISEDDVDYAFNWYNYNGPAAWRGERLSYELTRHELTGAAGQSSVQFRFTVNAVSGGGSGALIDSVVVDSRPDVDVKFRSWSLGSDEFALTSSSSLNITLVNLGLDTLYTIPFAYEVDGPSGTTLYKDTLNYASGVRPNAFVSFFTATVDATDKGDYSVVAYTTLAGDANNLDDTLRTAFTHREVATFSDTYTQDFESVGTQKVFTVPMSVNGLTGWYYSDEDDENVEDGEVSFNSGDAANGSGAACFTFTESGWSQYLELTLDMSAYSASSDVVVMDLNILDNATYTAFNDQIALRGNKSDSYYEVFDWQSSTTGVWENTGIINLSDALTNNSQDFSAYTQIKIEVDRYAFGATEKVCFDDLRIYVIDDNVQQDSISISSTDFSRSSADDITVWASVQGGTTQDSVLFQATLTYPNASQEVLRDTVVGSFAQGDSVFAKFSGLDLTLSGNYTLDVVTRSTDDLIPDDDSATYTFSTRTVASFPYTQDFESVTNSSYSTSSEIAGAAGMYYEGNAGLFGLTNAGASAINGAQAAFLGGIGTNALILTVDLSGKAVATDSVYLSFMLREYGDESNNEDKVFVRGSYTETWIELLNWNTAGIDGQSKMFVYQLGRTLANNGQEFSSSTQIKFGQRDNLSFPTDGLVVDDISLASEFTDVSLAGILGVGVQENATTRDFTVQITNNGYSELANLPIKLRIDLPSGDSLVLRDTLVGPLAVAGSADVVFGGVDVSTQGTYTLSAEVTLANDQNQNDNSLTGETFVNYQIVGALPWAEGFETGNIFTIRSLGSFNSWEVGVPANTLIDTAYEGTQAFVTNLDGSYANNEYVYITSPLFDFSGLTLDPRLTFAMQFNSESCCDYLTAQISVDSGNSWTTLGSDWYNNGTTWRGSNGEWQKYDQLLTGAAGNSSVQFRFLFDSDGSSVYEGFALDDFEVREQSATDAEMISVVGPASFNLSTSETVSTTFTNSGVDNISSMIVSLEVSKDTVTTYYEQTYSNLFVPGDTVTLDFSGVDLTSLGEYGLKAWVAVAGDDYHDNDTTYGIATNREAATLPFIADFSDVEPLTLTSNGGIGIPGLFYQTPTADGIFQSQYSSSYTYLGEPGAAFLGGTGTNELILTLDLGDKNVDLDDVYLYFLLRDFNDEVDEEDGVFVRGSVNDTWQLLYDWQSNTHYYTNDPNSLIAINDTLAKYGQVFSNTTQIKFAQKGTSSLTNDGIVIDNIVVAEGITDIRTGYPYNSNGYTTTLDGLDVYYTIYNDGTVPVDSATQEIWISNSALGMDTVFSREIALNLAANAEKRVYLGELPIYEPGAYSIYLLNRIPGDMDLFDNGWFSNTFRIFNTIESLPFQEGFEDNSEYFSVDGEWEIGVPADSAIKSAYEGTQAIVLDLDNDYNTYRYDYIYTPFFDFSRYTADPIVSFALQYLTVSEQDGVWVEVNTGSGWNKLGTKNYSTDSEYGQNWYNTSGDWWTGNSGGIVVAQHEAIGAAGKPKVQFRFIFDSDGSVNDEGVLIDDFRIRAQTVTDILVYAVQGNPMIAYGLDSTNQDLTIGLANLGSFDVSTISLNLSDGISIDQDTTLNTTLLAGDSLEINLGSYPVTSQLRNWVVSLDSATDDINQNDTLRLATFSRTPAALPYFEDFAEIGNVDLNGDVPLPAGLENAFVIGETAEVSITNYNNLGKVIRLRGVHQSDLVLSYNLSGVSSGDPLVLSFDFYNESIDEVAGTGIFVRGNPSQDWIKVASYYEIKPNTYTWENSGPVDIGKALSEAGQAPSSNTQVRFGRYDDYLYAELYLDNIRLISPAVDLGILSFTVPTEDYDLTSNETLTLQINNGGRAFSGSASLEITIENPDGSTQTVTKSVPGPFAIGEVRTVNVSGVDLSSYGNYNLTATLSVAGDEVAANNTAEAITNNVRLVSDFPFTASFEQSGDGFYLGGTNNSWEWGAPEGAVHDAAYNGRNAWVTNLDGDYNNSESSYLYLPELNLSSFTTDPVLSFMMKLDIEECCDYGQMQVSTDGGFNWSTLGLRTEDANVDSSLVNNWIESNGRWRNDVTEFTFTSYPLNGLAGENSVKLRFYLRTDGSVTREGFLLDAFQVSQNLNRLPTIDSVLQDVSVAPGFGSYAIDYSGVFSDPDGDPLTYTITVVDTSVVTASVTSGTSFNLVENGVGDTRVVIAATDDSGAGVEAVFTFNVNQAPVLVNPIPDTTFQSGINWVINLASVFEDASIDSLRYSAATTDSAVAYITMDGARATVVDGGQGGTATLSVTATDNFGLSTTDDFVINVNAQPTWRDGTPLTDTAFVEGFGNAAIDLTAQLYDPDGGALFFELSAPDTTVVRATLDESFLRFAEVSTGVTSLSMVVTDEEGGSLSFNLAVGVGSAPVINDTLTNQSYDAGFGSATIDISSAFTDPNGQTLTYSIAESVTGVFTFTLGNGFITVDELGAGATDLTITATNEYGLKASQTIVVVVNTAPVGEVLSNLALIEGFGEARLNLYDFFTDAEGDSLTFEASSSDESVIQVSVVGDSLVMTEGDVLGTATISLTAEDPYGASGSSGLRVEVTSINGLPLIARDLVVYPVPATSEVTLDLDLRDIAEVEVMLTDVTGRSVYHQELGTAVAFRHTIPVRELSAGTWYLTLIIDGERYTQPVIKQ